jgi:hypothetical protein
MSEKRTNFQAVALSSTEVIVFGGFNGRSTLCSVEKFDVVLNEWKYLKPMKFARMDFG